MRRRPKPPVISALAVRPGAAEAFEPSGVENLRRLVAAFGNNVTARLMGVDRAQVSRWNRGKDPLSYEMRSRIIDLGYVVDRALQMMAPKVVGHWLVGAEPLLGGAHPIDVLFLNGAGPLISALDGIYEGVHV